ncbi:hypothetical protein ACKWTF_016727 [Chironomus riparius]
MMKIQRKAFEASKAIKYFTTHNWTFKDENFDSFSAILKEDDVRAFDIRKYETYSPILISRTLTYGIRKYLLKLKDEDLEKDRKNFKIMKIISFIIKILIFIGIIYFILCTFKEHFVSFLNHL